jgi:hypothetical protein
MSVLMLRIYTIGPKKATTAGMGVTRLGSRAALAESAAHAHDGCSAEDRT